MLPAFRKPAILQEENVRVPNKYKRKHTSVWWKIQNLAAAALAVLLTNQVDNNGLGKRFCVYPSSSRSKQLLPHPLTTSHFQLTMHTSAFSVSTLILGEKHHREGLEGFTSQWVILRTWRPLKRSNYYVYPWSLLLAFTTLKCRLELQAHE